jgi:hypothetical protein
MSSIYNWCYKKKIEGRIYIARDERISGSEEAICCWSFASIIQGLGEEVEIRFVTFFFNYWK